MSRWKTEFDNHAFQSNWKAIVEKANAGKIDDKTVHTSVEELARLRKVITFLQQIIANADVELIPLGTWDSFNQQAVNCLNEMTSYENNRDVGHIKNANFFADNLLTYLKPYEIPSKKVGDTYQAAFKAYAATIEAYTIRFDETAKQSYEKIVELEKESAVANNDIASIKTDIQNYKDELLGAEDDTISKRIEAIYISFFEKNDELVKYYNDTFVDAENKRSIRTEIKSVKTAIEDDKSTIETLIKNVQAQISAINAFSIEILGNDELDAASLKFQFEELIGKLVAFETKQNQKYQELNKQIEALLPGATNAALASAYGEMKDTFNQPIKNNTRLFCWTLVFMFFVTLCSFLSDTWTYNNGWSYTPPNLTEGRIFLSLAHKLPFYLPLIWLAYFASKRRSEAQRLQQEYAHKESLAKSYDSYKKQIEALGDTARDLQRNLIDRAIDVIAYNASTTLDGKHGDKMPAQEFVDTFKDVKTQLPKN